MEKEFAPYQESLELKALGFDEECFGYYVTVEVPNPFLVTTKISDTQGGYFTFAPIFSQAFRWFRENYSDLDFGVGKIYNGNNTYHYHINLSWEYFEGTYEEAELACLRKLIEIVKNGKTN